MASFKFDDSKFHPLVAVDSSFLMYAIDKQQDDGGMSDALLRELRVKRVTIIVPAPVFGEFIIKAPWPFPVTPEIQVLPYDDVAALLLAKVGNAAIRNVQDSGHAHHIVRYDAMIVATAKRHNAGLLIAGDGRPDMVKICRAMALPLLRPDQFEKEEPRRVEIPPSAPEPPTTQKHKSEQGTLFSLIPQAATPEGEKDVSKTAAKGKAAEGGHG